MRGSDPWHRAPDILDLISPCTAQGEPFALATVVSTVSATAAKAGAKAVILPDGTIYEGWIGGGCARAAVIKAAKDSLADGKSRLVSVQPPDALDEQGLPTAEEAGGVRFAKNFCPSQGTMDIFVEPVLPRPEIVVCGSSPVAVAIADLARRGGFAMTVCAPASEQAAFGEVDRRIEGYALPVEHAGHRFIVVSTQSLGDEAALAGGAGGRCRLRRFRRQPPQGGGPEGELAQRGVAPSGWRAQRAGRSRSRRDHARRDRHLDPGGDRRNTARQACARQPQ